MVTVTGDPAGARSVNSPSIPVAAPFCVPSTTTVAPMTGCPDASTTRPLTDCACACVPKNRATPTAASRRTFIRVLDIFIDETWLCLLLVLRFPKAKVGISGHRQTFGCNRKRDVLSQVPKDVTDCPASAPGCQRSKMERDHSSRQRRMKRPSSNSTGSQTYRPSIAFSGFQRSPI